LGAPDDDRLFGTGTLETDARERLIAGNLDVEITPDSLKANLDRKLGVDNRLSKSTYDCLVRVLKGIGFADLSQVDACIAPFDDGALSRITEGWKQGQATRLEHMLAGTGTKHSLIDTRLGMNHRALL
jgi:hypothetical protein